ELFLQRRVAPHPIRRIGRSAAMSAQAKERTLADRFDDARSYGQGAVAGPMGDLLQRVCVDASRPKSDQATIDIHVVAMIDMGHGDTAFLRVGLSRNPIG